MGRIALAAKVSHLPARHGDSPGLRDIGNRARALGVETVVVFDSQWRAPSGHAVNCNAWLEGVATSGGHRYGCSGNAVLGGEIAAAAARRGVAAREHEFDNLALSDGVLVPLRMVDTDQRLKVVACAAGLGSRALEDSRAFGAAVREAVVACPGSVMVLAAGPLSQAIDDEACGEFERQVDLRVVDLWLRGDWQAFCGMLPDYAAQCGGAVGMHDTAMLLGLLGWDEYRRGVEVVTPYAAAAGFGTLDAIFPVG